MLDVVAVLAPVRDAFGDGVQALHPGGVLGHRQPHAFSAVYASCSVLGLKPSARPRPWQIIRSLRGR